MRRGVYYPVSSYFSPSHCGGSKEPESYMLKRSLLFTLQGKLPE